METTLNQKVEKAYPPVTYQEFDLLKKFKKDIAPLNGDPLFYEPVHTI